jgi:hypothetical protein
MHQPFTPDTPPPALVTGRPPKYPFATMPVGTVFTVPAGTIRLESMQLYARRRSLSLEKKFTARKLINGDIEVYRRA